MIEEVRIRITGENDMKSTLDGLEKVGEVDKKNADQFKKSHEDFKKQTHEKKEELTRLEEKAQNLAERIIAAFAVERVIEFGKESVKAFADAEAQYRKLEIAMTTVNGRGKKAFMELIEQSEALSKSLNNLFTPKQIQAVQTQLANFGLTTEEIKQLVPRILDLSRATGKDLNEVTEKSILALNGQTKGLRDVGISFKDTGSKTQNFSLLMQDLTKFQGAAADSLTTFDAKMQRFGNDVERVEEILGKFIAGELQDLENSLADLADFFQGKGNLGDSLKNFLSFETLGLSTKIFGESTEQYLTRITESAKQASEQVLRLVGNDLMKAHAAYLEATKQIGILNQRMITADEVGKQSITIRLNALHQLQKELQKVGQVEKIVNDLTLKGEDDAEAAWKKKVEAMKKYFELIYDSVKKQVAALELLQREGESDIEKENRTYEERLKAANLFGRDRESMTEEELKTLEHAEAQHQLAILKIDDQAGKKRLKLLLDYQKQEDDLNKIIIDFETQRTKEVYERQYENEKITKEEFDNKMTLLDDKTRIAQDQRELDDLKSQQQKKLALLEKEHDEGLISETEYQTELNKMRNEIASSELKLQKDTDQLKVDEAEITNKKIENILNQTQEFTMTIVADLEKAIEEKISNIDHLEDVQRQKTDTQRALAIAGKQNDLAFEIAQQDKLEKQRMIEQKKLKKAKELEIFLNAVANYSKDAKNPAEAISKAVAELAVVKAVEATYAEKGALLGHGGERSMVGLFGASRRHPGGGDILVHAQKGEGLLSRGEVAALGGADGFFMLKAALAGHSLNHRRIPLTAIQDNSAVERTNRQLMEKIDKLNETIEKKPDVSIDFDGLGNMIVTHTEKGIKEATTYILKKARIKG